MTRRVSEIEEIYIAAMAGIADSGTTTTLVDSDLSAWSDDAFNNMILSIIEGTNEGQSRRISDFVSSTGTITVDTAFTSAIDETSEYIIKHMIVFAAGATAASVWAHPTRTLTDPDSYKADISALALEATLTAIKGTTWSTETLKAIYDAIAALNDLAQSDILSDATPFAGADIATIKGYVDEAESLLKNATYGLSALNTDLDAVLVDTAAIIAYIDEVESLLKDGTYGLSALETLVDEIESLLKNATYGLSALNTDLDAILADTADMQPRVPRITGRMDFWSQNDDEIALTTSAGADHNLPNCVVAGLPSGVTIIRVVAMLKIAIIKDTSTSDNAINGATALKVDAAADYSSTVTAITIPDNSWAVDVSEATERGGDVMIGDSDVKAEVTGNATYYARLEDIVCDGNNLKLKDVAWGLRIYYTV